MDSENYANITIYFSSGATETITSDKATFDDLMCKLKIYRWESVSVITDNIGINFDQVEYFKVKYL